MALPVIKTTFYANGKAVWSTEWYESLSQAKIDENIKRISESGLGQVEALSDTTGRYISFDANGGFLKEIED